MTIGTISIDTDQFVQICTQSMRDDARAQSLGTLNLNDEHINVYVRGFYAGLKQSGTNVSNVSISNVIPRITQEVKQRAA